MRAEVLRAAASGLRGLHDLRGLEPNQWKSEPRPQLEPQVSSLETRNINWILN